jgi:ferredoxin
MFQAAVFTSARRPNAAIRPQKQHWLTATVRPKPETHQLRTGELLMKVTVDFDNCASTGACMQVCPEVFEVRTDGYLYILEENPSPELADKVNQAADMCPTAAITVE